MKWNIFNKFNSLNHHFTIVGDYTLGRCDYKVYVRQICDWFCPTWFEIFTIEKEKAYVIKTFEEYKTIQERLKVYDYMKFYIVQL